VCDCELQFNIVNAVGQSDACLRWFLLLCLCDDNGALKMWQVSLVYHWCMAYIGAGWVWFAHFSFFWGGRSAHPWTSMMRC